MAGRPVAAVVLAGALLLTACSGGGNGTIPAGRKTPPGRYGTMQGGTTTTSRPSGG